MAQARPQPILASWAGVDRSHIPKTNTAGPRPTEVDDPAWMGTLIANANLRFTGAYVTGPAIATPANAFTNSTKAVERGWMRNLAALAAQGWGFAFFYVGYSIGGGEAAPANADRTRGDLHGRHLRTIMHQHGPRFAGSVVIIDNEDGESDILPANLIQYYLGLFEAMSRPDPALRAFRPGIYGHGQPLNALLAVWPDLFIWDVQIDGATTTTPIAPMDPAIDPIRVDLAAIRTQAPPGTDVHPVPIRSYPTVLPPQRPPAFSWPLGRQFRFHAGSGDRQNPPADIPLEGSATERRLRQRWRRVRTWDYDASFVRNPASAIAEPRIAALGDGPAFRLVRGRFAFSASGTIPLQHLQQAEPPTLDPLMVDPFTPVEPEAPLVPAEVGARAALYTVLTNGEIGEAIGDTAGRWGPLGSIGAGDPPPRTPRALGVAARSAADAHLVYIAENGQLHAKRKAHNQAWSRAALALAAPLAHPFSSLAVCPRGGQMVFALFIDGTGLLHAAHWARSFSSWPAFQVQALEQTPSLFRGTALTAITPRPEDVLVFAVGRDGRLSFAVFNEGSGWSRLTPVGAATDRLGAHSRLAAYAMDDRTVEVAALTDAARLAVYRFDRNGNAWTPAPRTVLDDPPALRPGRTTAEMTRLRDAAGCRINPFGDIGLGRPAGAVTTRVYCAGLADAQNVLLTRDLGPGGLWQVLA